MLELSLVWKKIWLQRKIWLNFKDDVEAEARDRVTSGSYLSKSHDWVT